MTSTRQPFADEESLARFRDAISSACAPVHIRPAEGTAFSGSLRSVRADGLIIAQLRTSPTAVTRAGRLLSSGDPEFIKLAWQRHGSSHLEQDGRRCVVPAGHLVAYETTRPYRLHSDDPAWEAVIVAVPRDRLGPHARPISERTALPVPAGSGAGRALTLLVEELTRCSEAEPAALHLADALTSMMLAVYAGLSPAAGVERVTLADRIRAHALANLGDPGLCVESIATCLNVSVRQVHKACAQEGFTAAAWIRRQRLERVRRDLLDPALAGRSTAAIAARWGLVDVTHLARQFRAVFGDSPAELRRAGVELDDGRLVTVRSRCS
ncbi:helix-turn-helix domain-containing protein [Cryptosporangium aurantiacum]|uniref:AraC-type DNA-binding protein n=1 Tax=Cryptosporangium aurantiacum TaxID=134849 RepID=A0A1M7L0D6_9ACTN|nr:helix-turn-helix domain-containing protein [Cryptosporangium aurantiacum]SHM71304.1 AraC-type DNA-binding protein [Cryptosporangium aurantiacum]